MSKSKKSTNWDDIDPMSFIENSGNIVLSCHQKKLITYILAEDSPNRAVPRAVTLAELIQSMNPAKDVSNYFNEYSSSDKSTKSELPTINTVRMLYGSLDGESYYGTSINAELLELLVSHVELESIPGQIIDHRQGLTCGSSYEEHTDFITRDVVCYSRDIYFDLELGDIDLVDNVAILAIRSKTSIRTTKDGSLETYPTEIVGIDINLYNEDNRPDKK